MLVGRGRVPLVDVDFGGRAVEANSGPGGGRVETEWRPVRGQVEADGWTGGDRWRLGGGWVEADEGWVKANKWPVMDV